MHVHIHAIFKECWQTLSYKHFSGREKFSREIDFFIFVFFVALQKMIWVWAAVLRHRTFKHHRLNLHMLWTHRPPILWHRICWVKLMRRKTATLVQSIIITTILTITRDFLTLTRNTKCQHRPPQMFTSTIRDFTAMEWSDKSNTSLDKFHGKWKEKYF